MEQSSAKVLPDLSQYDNLTAETSNERCTQAIDLAINGLKNLVQTADTLLPILVEATKRCYIHAMKFGDVMPMDRLVKGVPDHRACEFYRWEIVAWNLKYGPVRWDAKGNPSQSKEGDKGYVPYDPAKAFEQNFHETPEAKKAAAIGAAVRQRELQEVSRDNFVNRVMGLRKWFENAQKPDDNGHVRGVKETDYEFIRDGIVVLEGTLQAYKAGKIKAGDETPEALKAANNAASGKAETRPERAVA